MKNILFVLGTARAGRQSEKVAQFVLAVAKEHPEIKAVFADVRDYPQSATEGLPKELLNKWDTMVKEADAVVIISPEYNHGYPGELKMLLDNSYDAYKNKPVAICGVSNGTVGGARMAEQLKLVLLAFQVLIINASVYFTNVTELFDDKGQINNEPFWRQKVNGVLNEIIKHAK